MSVVSAIVVYIIVWWMLWFMVLPWGVRAPERVEPGHADSAPERPMLRRKVWITTALAALVWALFWVIYETGWIQLRSGQGLI